MGSAGTGKRRRGRVRYLGRAITCAGAVQNHRRRSAGGRIRPNKTKQNQATAKLNQAILLGFIWFYSSESGLFNGLQRIQIRKSPSPSQPLRKTCRARRLRKMRSLSRLAAGRLSSDPVDGKVIARPSIFAKQLFGPSRPVPSSAASAPIQGLTGKRSERAISTATAIPTSCFKTRQVSIWEMNGNKLIGGGL